MCPSLSLAYRNGYIWTYLIAHLAGNTLFLLDYLRKMIAFSVDFLGKYDDLLWANRDAKPTSLA